MKWELKNICIMGNDKYNSKIVGNGIYQYPTNIINGDLIFYNITLENNCIVHNWNTSDIVLIDCYINFQDGYYYSPYPGFWSTLYSDTQFYKLYNCEFNNSNAHIVRITCMREV
jgi:hypothetical protein